MTPLLEKQTEIKSDKSSVNPFSIAGKNIETSNELLVTAEGFFKNPNASI